MAVAAFKSASRRGTSTTPPQPASAPASSSGGGSGKAAQPPRHRSGGDAAKKVVPPRRSRSVSAFPRSAHLSVDSDFANKRDNPLYWSVDTDSPRLDGEGAAKVAKFDGAVSRLSGGRSKVSGVGVASSSVGGESRRGRSVTRYSDVVGGKSSAAAGGGGGGRGVGRSLSRVDTGRRRRSMSRGHYGNSESEREQESTSLRSRSKTISNAGRVDVKDKSGMARSDSDLSEVLKLWQSCSGQNPAFETSDASAVNQSSSFLPHWEDGGSMSSFSDAEERYSKPVSQHVNVMRRSSSSSTLSTDIADTPFELVIPAEAELVFEVRGEYARKLEESQERARKLRAELAVEEHREVELNQIIEEMIQHPETPEVKKPRAARKASRERRKMSKRLEDEALAYFDECVSISTFDESDFSSLEDPLSNILGNPDHGNKVNLPGRSAPISMNPCLVQSPDPSNPMLPKNTPSHSNSNNNTLFESPSTSSLSSSKSSWKRQFSFSDKRKDGSGSALEQELRSYIKTFAKDGRGKESSSSSRTVNRHRHDTDEYVFCVPTEKFLFERATFKNRIDSGGMLLCGGATFSLFSVL